MLLQRSSFFQKKFNASTRKMQDKISARLDLFMSDEFAVILNNHELHGEYAGCRSINVTGDVRIIYEKHGGDVQFLMDFGTHGQLYE